MGDERRQVEAGLPEWNRSLPEWGDGFAGDTGDGSNGGETDDAAWIAAIEASRRRQFAELSELQ